MRFLARLADVGRPPSGGPPLRRARRPSWRWLRAAAAVLAVAGVFGAGAWLQHNGAAIAAVHAADERFVVAGAKIGLSIKSVEVEGRKRASRESILEALRVQRGSPTLAFDPVAAKARLEALPWIRSAAVERRLPDTIRVRLVERRPLAFWQRRNKLILVDGAGVILATDHLETFGPLLVLVGDDAPAQAAALRDLLATERELASRVEAAVRIGNRRWNLRLDSGVEIELPEADPASAWHHLAELDRSYHLLERNIQKVDLRVPDRLGICLVPEPPKAPEKKAGPRGRST